MNPGWKCVLSKNVLTGAIGMPPTLPTLPVNELPLTL